MPTVRSLNVKEHDAHSKRLLADFDMLDTQFADEDVSRARRAYYGSISYLDNMVGRLLDTLDAIGQSDNTAIVFTSDHGEMLGERGMWFKKHFFEPSLRIPLFIHIPDVSPGRAATPASLVDLLPTFLGIATGDAWTSDVESLEGRNLSPLIVDTNNNDNKWVSFMLLLTIDRPIYAEYLAEATTAPIFMIRRGHYKFISSSADPALLFNLSMDPQELNNLAGCPEHRELVTTFQSEVDSKWDTAELSEKITLSQRRRRLVIDAYQHGQKPRWNHEEGSTDSVIWYRGEQGYNEWAFDYLPIRKLKS